MRTLRYVIKVFVEERTHSKKPHKAQASGIINKK
jgi:hypothetical protein